MRILALDLGVTTGWASIYRSKDGMAGIVASGVLSYEGYTAQLPTIISSWEFDHVVMELPLLIARGQLRDQLDNVVAWTMSAIGTMPRTEVYASDWKATRYAKAHAKALRRTTSHEKDACRMGLWFTETKLQGA